MKKKILLLFSLIILCVPLIQAQVFNQTEQHWFNTYYTINVVTSETVDAAIRPVSLKFENGTEVTLTNGSTTDKNNLTSIINVLWESNILIKKQGISGITVTPYNADPAAFSGTYNLPDVTVNHNSSAHVYFYGVNANGVEVLVKDFVNHYQGAFVFTAGELVILKKYGKIRIQIDLDTPFADSETQRPVTLADWSTKSWTPGTPPTGNACLSWKYCAVWTPTPSVSNSRSQTLILNGEPDTKITGVEVTGATSSNNSVNVSQGGMGIIALTECNITDIKFNLSNVDFSCQTIKSLLLKDASGNLKKTFSASEYTLIGGNQIDLSLVNTASISDNDRLVITLTNTCTTNLETDYTIVLGTETKDGYEKYLNTQLYPDKVNKVPISISQKVGSKWCDNSSAFFFNVSGANGYTNINFSNTTPDGASFSVAKGQSGILGNANYYKCLTNVNIPIPATKMPKASVISDLQYCDGTNFTLPINNPSDYTTETFRLLLDGVEKFGWQGTKSFTTNLGKVGSASAVVESNNGECQIASNTATINSRIQPVALAFNGSLSYYTEQVNTTIVQTAQQDGVTYKIFKDGSATAQDTWIGIKAQTLTKGSYRITAENANASCSAETNLVITEKDLNIGAAWTTDELSFCQLEGTKDLNSFVSFNGASSVFTSTAGLSITGSNVDLATSTAGTYIITCTAIKDGITKVFTKNFTVKPKANDITLSLINTTDFSCNTDNPKIQVTTDYPGYNYTWYKGATIVDGTERTNTIALTKAEGSQNFTAVATATNGCKSSPSTALVLIKNNLTADINFTSGIKSYCQSIAGTANLFDDLTGSDRIAVSLEQSGWTYNVTTSSSDMILLNRNQIDLERSKAGTYTITMAYSQNGCTKTITKQYTIKQMPSNVTVTLDNASTIECDLTNANAQVHASNSNYTYNWTKNGVALTDNTQAVSIPVSKADGLTTIYAHPVLDGCVGLKSNEVSLTKRYVVADVTFSTGVTEYCQKTGGSIDIFTELSGTDKIAVVNSQSGYTWSLTPSGTGLKVTGSTINLETSQAGTYTVTLTISKDGCSKNITKDVMIRMRPADFTIALTNSTDFACNNSNAEMAASVTSYSYKWYKGGTDAGTGTTISIPTTKSDLTNASRTIYAIGTATNGCETNPTPNLILPLKTFIEANFDFTTGVSSFCQTVGTTLDMRTLISGSDKDKVLNEQDGFTWDLGYSTSGMLFTDIKNSIINLEKSYPQTYTSSLNIRKDGCIKTITKGVVIKPRPIPVDISLMNSENLACNTNDAQFKAAVSIYTYNWYKNATQLTETSQNLTLPIAKSDGLISVSAYPVLDGCIGVKTNVITTQKLFVDANFEFSSGTTSWCQKKDATVDLFAEASGTDKLAIQQKQNGWNWSISSANLAGLGYSGSLINLETSKAGYYNINFILTKDGCSKTFVKSISIKQKPLPVTISLQNAGMLECDLSNPNALLIGDNKDYLYKWYKNGAQLTDYTQSISIPVSKTDGATSIYAVPQLGYCLGDATNSVVVTKRFIEANLSFSENATSYCQYPAKKVDIFTELSGTDKQTIQDKQNGWDWSFAGSTPDLVILGSEINLETSKPGSYTVTMTITKDGCSKSLTKSVVVKAQPSNVVVTLDNASTVECDLSNPNALVKAENSAYSYNWTKNGTLLTTGTTQTMSIPVSKADGLTTISAVPVLNGCIGLKSNEVSLTKRFVEANLSFSANTSSYCQYPAKKVDMFTELSGTDKVAIQGKQNDWDWSFTGSTPELVIDGSEINLETSAAGTYTVTMTITKDGCSKTISKSVVIKAQPSNVVVTLDNASTVECDLSNPNAQVHADNSAYSYNWTKNGVAVNGTTQTMSIPVSKADGLTTISAVPVLNGCIGLKSNEVSLTKRFVEADFGFNNTPITLASKDEAVNLFDYTVGKDKDAIINQTGGYSYKIDFTPVKQTTIGSTDGSVIPATGLQAGDTQYTLNVIVSKNGCDLTYSKTAVIKSIPRNISIDFATAQSTQECTSDNYMNVVASDPTLVYKWYKNDLLVSGQTTYKATIEVFKTDGTVKIFAVPSTKDGFDGYKTNILNATKRYVTADLQLDGKTETFCAVAGKKINVFDYVRGSDKAAVIAGQYGYTYNTSGDCGTTIATNQYVDVDNSLADDNATKTVSLTVSQNGCSITQNKTFVIKRRPSDITIELLSKASNTANSNMFCGGDTLSLHVSSSNNTGVSYNWYKDGQLIGNSKTTNFAYPFNDASGLINLSATAAFENSCQSTASNVIPVSKKDVKFDIALDPSAVAYCPETKKINMFDYVSGADKNNVMTQSNNCTYEFTATGNNGLAIVSYSFLDLDNSTSSTSPYILTMNVNKEGCMKSFSKNVSIKQRPTTPLITLTSNSELRYCAGDVVTLTDKNTQTGTYYKWTVNGTDIAGSNSSILKYTTDQASEIGVQAISYFNSNSCPSKSSDVLKVSNVVPRVDIKLINTTVTVNDLIQFYVFESTSSKSIKLTATRVSDKTVTDLPYTREGNVITLSGILPIGEYSFNAVAENVLTGYCSQNIAIANTLTVRNSTKDDVSGSGISHVSSSEEVARKTIYDEYMALLKKGEVRSILLPILTSSYEPAKLTVYTTDDDESVTIRIVDVQGHVISSRTEFLMKGQNDFTIKADEKPTMPGMYLVTVEYSKSHKSETLKGLVK